LMYSPSCVFAVQDFTRRSWIDPLHLIRMMLSDETGERFTDRLTNVQR
jgi:hypothetical protein